MDIGTSAAQRKRNARAGPPQSRSRLTGGSVDGGLCHRALPDDSAGAREIEELQRHVPARVEIEPLENGRLAAAAEPVGVKRGEWSHSWGLPLLLPSFTMQYYPEFTHLRSQVKRLRVQEGPELTSGGHCEPRARSIPPPGAGRSTSTCIAAAGPDT